MHLFTSGGTMPQNRQEKLAISGRWAKGLQRLNPESKSRAPPINTNHKRTKDMPEGEAENSHVSEDLRCANKPLPNPMQNSHLHACSPCATARAF